ARSTATSAGRDKRSPTRSANACGSSAATTSVGAPARASTSSRSTRACSSSVRWGSTSSAASWGGCEPLYPAGDRCRLLGCDELLLDDGETAVPEPGIREVDAHHPAQLLGRRRAATRQQVEVGRHELGSTRFVLPVHAERQELPVRVGVDVARRADE